VRRVLHLSPGLPKRLSLFPGHALRQFIQMVQHQTVPVVQDGRPLLGGTGRPAGKGPVRGIHRPFHILRRGLGCGSDHLPCRRIQHVKGLPAAGRSPLSVDVKAVFFHEASLRSCSITSENRPHKSPLRKPTKYSEHTKRETSLILPLYHSPRKKLILSLRVLIWQEIPEDVSASLQAPQRQMAAAGAAAIAAGIHFPLPEVNMPAAEADQGVADRKRPAPSREGRGVAQSSHLREKPAKFGTPVAIILPFQMQVVMTKFVADDA